MFRPKCQSFPSLNNSSLQSRRDETQIHNFGFDTYSFSSRISFLTTVNFCKHSWQFQHDSDLTDLINDKKKLLVFEMPACTFLAVPSVIKNQNIILWFNVAETETCSNNQLICKFFSLLFIAITAALLINLPVGLWFGHLYIKLQIT